jgi:3-deoxy-D-manno-octulosonic-acid transferase
VIVTGSLKYDTAQIADTVEGADTLATRLNIVNERLWVAGATGDNEEAIILDVYRSLKDEAGFDDLRLAIVPRKPERFGEVDEMIREKGFVPLRYSQIKDKATSGAEKSIINNKLSINTVILGDTMGDLRKFYSLASVIFVGRSLVPMGGSDMMEAAALGKCTIFGPHAFNFKQAVDALLADQGAILVNNKDELLKAIKKCILEPEYAKTVAEKGREIIRKNQGATARTIKQISHILNVV